MYIWLAHILLVRPPTHHHKSRNFTNGVAKVGLFLGLWDIICWQFIHSNNVQMSGGGNDAIKLLLMKKNAASNTKN